MHEITLKFRKLYGYHSQGNSYWVIEVLFLERSWPTNINIAEKLATTIQNVILMLSSNEKEIPILPYNYFIVSELTYKELEPFRITIILNNNFELILYKICNQL